MVFELKNCEILQTKGCQSQHYKNAFKVKVKHSKCVHYCSKYSTHTHLQALSFFGNEKNDKILGKTESLFVTTQLEHKTTP